MKSNTDLDFHDDFIIQNGKVRSVKRLKRTILRHQTTATTNTIQWIIW